MVFQWASPAWWRRDEVATGLAPGFGPVYSYGTPAPTPPASVSYPNPYTAVSDLGYQDRNVINVTKNQGL